MSKIAVVGGNGNFGLKRVQALQKIGCEIDTICDISFDKVSKLINVDEVNLTSEINFLDRKEIDTVIISVPDNLKYDIILECLTAGKNVLVEKPLSNNEDNLKLLFTLAKKKGLVLYCAYNISFFPQNQ